MKKMILIVFISVMMLSPAYASEEIQLASAIGKSSSTKADVADVKKNDDNDAAALRLGGKKSVSDMVTAGIFAATALAIIVEGGSSSASNH